SESRMRSEEFEALLYRLMRVPAGRECFIKVRIRIAVSVTAVCCNSARAFIYIDVFIARGRYFIIHEEDVIHHIHTVLGGEEIFDVSLTRVTRAIDGRLVVRCLLV